uniref:helix-turn-helix domain-containing protein n=1 Tax=Nocardia brevicatena TaxID=37327 RepID=UPI001C3F333C
VIVAGGMESMSRAPHLLPASRTGYTYGDVTLIDHMAYDGLRDAFTDQPMGLLTEIGNDRHLIARTDQDAFAARSHRFAAEAWDSGVFDDEVVSVEIPARRGPSTWLSRDEGIRPDTTVETLAAVRARGQRPGRPPAMTAEQIRQARMLLARPDESVSSIARLLGVSRTTLYKYVPELTNRQQ